MNLQIQSLPNELWSIINKYIFRIQIIDCKNSITGRYKNLVLDQLIERTSEIKDILSSSIYDDKMKYKKYSLMTLPQYYWTIDDTDSCKFIPLLDESGLRVHRCISNDEKTMIWGSEEGRLWRAPMYSNTPKVWFLKYWSRVYMCKECYKYECELLQNLGYTKLTYNIDI